MYCVYGYQKDNDDEWQSAVIDKETGKIILYSSLSDAEVAAHRYNDCHPRSLYPNVYWAAGAAPERQ